MWNFFPWEMNSFETNILHLINSQTETGKSCDPFLHSESTKITQSNIEKATREKTGTSHTRRDSYLHC